VCVFSGLSIPVKTEATELSLWHPGSSYTSKRLRRSYSSFLACRVRQVPPCLGNVEISTLYTCAKLFHSVLKKFLVNNSNITFCA